ncbi:MAG: hypothetical protein ACW96X_13195 [Promethearchaeota archaeon]|jgi:hypothetical protein
MSKPIQNVVVFSDTHCGCQFGLSPLKIRLDAGGFYNSSSLQKKVFKMWRLWWDEYVPEFTRGEPYVIVVNGDAIDGSHHKATTQVSQNIKDQRNIFIEVMNSVLGCRNCKGLYMIRGTEVHVGKSAEDEEEIARTLGAIPDEFGNHSRYDLWFRLGKHKSLLHFTHHIGVTSSAAYEMTAINKELVEAYNEAGRWGDEPPDAVIRSHRHRQGCIDVASEKGRALSLCTPGWQLKTPFVYRGTTGRVGTPQIGGYVLREGDEDPLYSRYKVWKVKRPKEETLNYD